MKMALRTVSGPSMFVKYSERKAGEVVAQGEYVGDKDGKFGKLHLVATEDGVLNLPTTGTLKCIFGATVRVGDYVVVTYRGKKTISSGKMAGKEAHDFLVQVDDEAGKSS